MKDYAFNNAATTGNEVILAARSNTHRVAKITSESLRSFAESRSGPPSLHEVSSTKHVVAALYNMKGREFVQEDMGDDATIQILISLPMAYQLDVLVRKFKSSEYSYPTPDVILSIMCEMDDEGMFGPCVDRLD